MKLLVVLLALALLVWLMLGRSRQGRKRSGKQPTRAAPPPLEGMVACAHCGVHLPGSEAVLAQGLAYCGTAHRDLGPRPH